MTAYAAVMGASNRDQQMVELFRIVPMFHIDSALMCSVFFLAEHEQRSKHDVFPNITTTAFTTIEENCARCGKQVETSRGFVRVYTHRM